MAESIIPRSGVYAIRNTTNGKVYVGSSANIGRRFYEHKSCLRLGNHPSSYLQSAWLKHGEPAFEFFAIEIIENAHDLIASEQTWIDRLRSTDRRSGYNTCLIAGRVSRKGRRWSLEERVKRTPMLEKTQRGNVGKKRTAESKARMRSAQLGKKHPPEQVAKRVASMRANGAWPAFWKGKKMPAEVRAKISVANKGKKNSAESIAKMIASIAATRKPMSQEVRDKISATLTGRKHSEESKKRMSAASMGRGRGRKLSAETCAKISAARKGMQLSPETRAKIGAAQKGRIAPSEAIAKRLASRIANKNSKANLHNLQFSF